VDGGQQLLLEDALFLVVHAGRIERPILVGRLTDFLEQVLLPAGAAYALANELPGIRLPVALDLKFLFAEDVVQLQIKRLGGAARLVLNGGERARAAHPDFVYRLARSRCR